jgi:L-rhamnose isomerase / sugar isomerase
VKGSGLDRGVIAQANAPLAAGLERDYAALGDKLARQGMDAEALVSQIVALELAIPSWGVGTGGTRFARFAQGGEPRNIFDKLTDCAVIKTLTHNTPRVSLHFPWDHTDDMSGVRDFGHALGLGFDAVNSNTFQDQAGQARSYRYGSLSHTDAATREQAVEHNIGCIEAGKVLGAKALTVWVGDGANFPGQSHFTRSFERYLDSLKAVYAALPDDWRIFTEHKLYEPAFYATVMQDWGSNILCAQALGPKAFCLVDLGHHAPTVNIEMIVARLAQFKKLGGFHFNDSKYGDDDLDSGSINPFQLFLVFNELVEVHADQPDFAPALMMDQSHNVTDPIESLMSSANTIACAFARALIVDRAALHGYQDTNDALMAHQALKAAYETDVRPLVAMARYRNGAAIDPVAAYRASGCRARVTAERGMPVTGSAGIV